MQRECKLVPHGEVNNLASIFSAFVHYHIKKDALRWRKCIVLNSGVSSNLSYGGDGCWVSALSRTPLGDQQTLHLHISSICIHPDTCARALFNAPQRAEALALIRRGIQRKMTGGDYSIVLLTHKLLSEENGDFLK